MKLTFDGENCTYEGPTSFVGGPITQQYYKNSEGISPVKLEFFNNSEGMAAVNLTRHTGDEPIQDAIDLFRDEPVTGHAPQWMKDVTGVYGGTPTNKNRTWEGALEPGIYSMVCVRFTPWEVWFGTGLEVFESP